MGNLLSGDVTRLIPFGRVKTPRRFIKNPLSSQTTSASLSREARHAR
jgi:hypothetical protein